MPVSSGLDWILDRTVVPGYTRLGMRLRRHWWPADPPPGSLAGKVVAITGANSGLGKATTLGVARLGGEVRMLCRDLGRGQRARDEILERVPDATLHVDRCDVSDLGSLPGVAKKLLSDVPRLHGLVHNAGVLPPERTETLEGHELTLATHVLGPHLLIDALRPALVADGNGRVVFVASGGMYAQRLYVDDPEYTRDSYSGTTAYARTKRMQVHLAEEWARQLRSDGVAVHSMHPGWADTPGVQDSLPGFAKVTGPLLRSPEEGADTIVWLLASPEASESTGLFWHDRRPRTTSYLARTRPSPDEVRDLWSFCVDATGVPVA
jgi:NAD(P)-dependent dehydrogenase (short-subunit alcohol dehydrogenase family)